MDSIWIWPFELQEKIGEGGMGVVYRARYVKNDKVVAVKLVPEDVKQSTKERFGRELEILRKLRHPNIVLCFGGIAEDNRQFYAMELVEGGNLEELLERRTTLFWGEVIEMAQQMCAGLAYAHKHKVVHRDIKPGNFLISRQGTIKLADFGLATIAAARSITAAGKTVGTIRYMAPEQVRGKEAVPQTDLYGLGCVLFHMLTGHAPFDGETQAEILQKHLHAEIPRVLDTVHDCPKELSDLVSDLLAKSVEDRPASAVEVGKRLANISTVTVIEKPQAGERKTPRSVRRAPQQQGSSSTTEKEAPVGSGAQAKPAAVPVQPRSSAGMWLLALLSTVLMIVCTWLWEGHSSAVRARRLWMQTLQQESRPLKEAASDSLGELGQTDSVTVNALIEILDDPDRDNRRLAVEALALSGGNAKPALGRLKKLAKQDEDPLVRRLAEDSFEKIDAAPKPTRWITPAKIAVLAVFAFSAVFLTRKLKSLSPPAAKK